MRRTPRPLLIVGALALALGASACSSPKAEVAGAKLEATTTTTTSTTTTTAVPAPVAPLTGLPVAPEATGLVARPALAVKVDNSVEALPHDGLAHADVVIEVMVEGISRLMAVFQSQDAPSIGPTRSARHSDPDILALFGRPLFGWSGANDEVIAELRSVPWVVNVEWDRAPKAYARRGPKPAPHNLYTSSPALFARAEPGQAPPVPIFDWLSPGESPTQALPVFGASLSIGATPSQWVWDSGAGQFVRWEYGRPHVSDGGQVGAQNVVVLETRYSAGPKAETVGSGRAWVLVAGGVVEGTWSRPARTDRFAMTRADGTPIELTPGRTWVELVNKPPALMDPGTASALLASPR
jgi:hypothetical protein